LNQNIEELTEKFQKVKMELRNRFTGMQNVDRVSQNCAYNYLTWCLFVDFMRENNIVDRQEAENMITRHWANILILQRSILDRCEEEQHGVAFLSLLKELLLAREVRISGLSEYDNVHKPTVGFAHTRFDGSEVVCLLPGLTFEAVKNASKNAPIRGTARSICMQMKDLNVIIDTDKGKHTKTVRHQGEPTSVWMVNLKALEKLSTDDIKNAENISSQKVNQVGEVTPNRAVLAEAGEIF
jgi:hypothetical protein